MTGPRPHRMTVDYRIRFDEAGPDALVRGSALLGIVQDAAWRHSDVLGLTRAWYHERGLLWLVRAIDVRLVAPLATGDAVRVETVIVGHRRVMARRETRVTRADGAEAAVVLTDWVMTSTATGGPTRLPDEITSIRPDAPAFDPIRVDRSDPPPDAAVARLAVRHRDLDPVGHVNNGVYLDFLEEAVGLAGGAPSGALPRRAVLEYAEGAVGGDALVARTWPTTTGWTHRLERASDGATLTRGALEVGALVG